MTDSLPSIPRKASFYIQRSIGALLLLAMAATFFFSAYSKIYSDNAFDNFQWTFLDLGISSIFFAGAVARIMIGLELMLGLFLLFHIYLGSFTYKAIIAVLAIFILYLTVVILKQGNTGNCGCFGDKLAMKPMTAIWKNVIMIAVTILLMFIYPVNPYKGIAARYTIRYGTLTDNVETAHPEHNSRIKTFIADTKRNLWLFASQPEYILLLLALAAFTAPFLINRMYTGTEPEKYGVNGHLDLLYKYSPAPPVELRKGKHIVAFMSLTCPHCKKAAYLLQIIHHEHPDIPMFMVLDGADEFKKAFFDETHAEQVPYMLYQHTQDFMELAGPGVPAIYWVNNGVLEYKSTYTYYQLDPKYMEGWLRSEFKN